MITKSKIRKDDTVQVLAGKDKGKRGTVIRIIPKKDAVIVSGVNIAFLTMFTPDTITASFLGIMRTTVPRFPLSFPASTCTVSSFRIFDLVIISISP